MSVVPKQKWWLISIILVMIAAGAALAIIFLWPQPTFPAKITRQVDFGIFYPANNPSYKIQKSSVKYSSNIQVLSYTLTDSAGHKIYFNEQATPQSFTDVPQTYDKVVSNLNPYTSFDSVNGNVSLTQPSKINSNEVGVMNAKGTLLFVRTYSALSDNTWRQLFNSLQILTD